MSELEELKAKNKAMRKFLIEETENNKQLQTEVDRLRIENQEKSDQSEQLQMTNQRLLKRIESLQSNTSSQESKTAASWSIWGSGTVTKEQLEQVSKALKVAEEELEAKINENQHVHMRIFDLRQELQARLDELSEVKEQNQKQVDDLMGQIEGKSAQNKDLLEEVARIKDQCLKIQEEKNKIVVDHNIVVNNLTMQLQQLEKQIQIQVQNQSQRVPFDPFSERNLNQNQVKSSVKVRSNQQESLQKLKVALATQKSTQNSEKEVVEQNLLGSLVMLFNSLRNLFDGQLPVDETHRKQTAYLERMIELLHKAELQTTQLIPIILSKKGDVVQTQLATFSNCICQLCDYLVRNRSLELTSIQCNYVQESSQFLTATQGQSSEQIKGQLQLDPLAKLLSKIKLFFIQIKVPNTIAGLRAVCTVELPSLTTDFQQIATVFQKRLKFSFIYEVKSNSLVCLREDVLTSLRQVISQLLNVTQRATESLNACCDNQDRLNIQTEENLRITKAQKLFLTLKVQGLPGLSFSEQQELQHTLNKYRSQSTQLAQQLGSLQQEIVKQQDTIQSLSKQKNSLEMQIIEANKNLLQKEAVVLEYELKFGGAKIITPVQPLVTFTVQDLETKSASHCLNTTGHNMVTFLTNDSTSNSTAEEQNDVKEGLKNYMISLQSLASEDGPKPLNQLVNNAEAHRIKHLQEKSLQKILSMSEKLSSLQKKAQGSSQQLEGKEKIWEQRVKLLEEELQTKTTQLQKKVEQLIAEQSVVKKNYDSQIRVLTEHIIELTSQN